MGALLGRKSPEAEAARGETAGEGVGLLSSISRGSRLKMYMASGCGMLVLISIGGKDMQGP